MDNEVRDLMVVCSRVVGASAAGWAIYVCEKDFHAAWSKICRDENYVEAQAFRVKAAPIATKTTVQSADELPLETSRYLDSVVPPTSIYR